MSLYSVFLFKGLSPAALTVNNSAFCIDGFRMIFDVNSDYFLNSVNQLIFVMVKCCVFFAVRAEFLNIILTSFGFKGLRQVACESVSFPSFFNTTILETDDGIDRQSLLFIS
jgi:hypothetical protein